MPGGMTSVFVTPRDVQHDPRGFMTARSRSACLQTTGKHSRVCPRVPSPECIAFVKSVATQLSKPRVKLRVISPITCRLQTKR